MDQSIVRRQSDLENTKEIPLPKPSQENLPHWAEFAILLNGALYNGHNLLHYHHMMKVHVYHKSMNKNKVDSMTSYIKNNKTLTV